MRTKEATIQVTGAMLQGFSLGLLVATVFWIVYLW